MFPVVMRQVAAERITQPNVASWVAVSDEPIRIACLCAVFSEPRKTGSKPVELFEAGDAVPAGRGACPADGLPARGWPWGLRYLAVRLRWRDPLGPRDLGSRRLERSLQQICGMNRRIRILTGSAALVAGGLLWHGLSDSGLYYPGLMQVSCIGKYREGSMCSNILLQGADSTVTIPQSEYSRLIGDAPFGASLAGVECTEVAPDRHRCTATAVGPSRWRR